MILREHITKTDFSSLKRAPTGTVPSLLLVEVGRLVGRHWWQFYKGKREEDKLKNRTFKTTLVETA